MVADRYRNRSLSDADSDGRHVLSCTSSASTEAQARIAYVAARAGVADRRVDALRLGPAQLAASPAVDEQQQQRDAGDLVRRCPVLRRPQRSRADIDATGERFLDHRFDRL